MSGCVCAYLGLGGGWFAHADAMLCLDDLREWVWGSVESIPVYLREEDLREVRRVFRTLWTGALSVCV